MRLGTFVPGEAWGEVSSGAAGRAAFTFLDTSALPGGCSSRPSGLRLLGVSSQLTVQFTVPE